MFNRAIIVVLDSAGVGAMPDAADYGDVGASTIPNLAKAVGGIAVPNMEKMCLGRITEITGVNPAKAVSGAYGKMAEVSPCKDTTGGHWEIAGSPMDFAFPYYTENGFPEDVLEAFLRETGEKGILGNKAASGTEIITELGDEHMRTGFPIVYTSADSVFQIAAHEDVIPLPRLYELCKIAREKVMIGKHACGRIIARPFNGGNGVYNRTSNRHDYSMRPPKRTMMDELQDAGYMTVGVGKIFDIFDGVGVSETKSTKGDIHGLEVMLDFMKQKQNDKGLIFVNLVDFDMLYGHRRDPQKYAQELEWFDGALNTIKADMTDKDLLFITADHGCDPTFTGTDHTREYVPLLVYHKNIGLIDLGTRKSFADIAATVIENFALPKLPDGESFYKQIA